MLPQSRAATSGRRLCAREPQWLGLAGIEELPTNVWHRSGSAAPQESLDNCVQLDRICLVDAAVRLAAALAMTPHFFVLMAALRPQSSWVSHPSARLSTSWRRPPRDRNETGRCQTVDRCLGFAQASP